MEQKDNTVSTDETIVNLWTERKELHPSLFEIDGLAQEMLDGTTEEEMPPSLRIRIVRLT